MNHGYYQLDMPHSLTTYFLFCHLNAATVADNSFVTDTFIFSAIAFPFFGRTENPLAEKSVFLGTKGSVVDGLGFLRIDALEQAHDRRAVLERDIPQLGVGVPAETLRTKLETLTKQ